MARENLDMQVDVLKRLYRRQYTAGTLNADSLLALAAGAGTVMQDGSEVIAVTFEGGSTSALVMYPKEVVMRAALDVLDEKDPDDPFAGADRSAVYADLSRTRLET
jgi:DNA-binding LytR/AlgR family response regulator